MRSTARWLLCGPAVTVRPPHQQIDTNGPCERKRFPVQTHRMLLRNAESHLSRLAPNVEDGWADGAEPGSCAGTLHWSGYLGHVSAPNIRG